MFQTRQGDLLFVECAEVEGGEPIARENGKIVIAHGETTGHMHAVLDRGVRFVEVNESRFLVSDKKPFDVVHEEHAPAKLPAGTFRVIRQREYVAPEVVRVVVD